MYTYIYIYIYIERERERERERENTGMEWNSGLGGLGHPARVAPAPKYDMIYDAIIQEYHAIYYNVYNI